MSNIARVVVSVLLLITHSLCDMPKVNPNTVNPNTVNSNTMNPYIEKPHTMNPNIVNPNTVNPNTVNPHIEKPDTEKLDLEKSKRGILLKMLHSVGMTIFQAYLGALGEDLFLHSKVLGIELWKLVKNYVKRKK